MRLKGFCQEIKFSLEGKKLLKGRNLGRKR
jgi:hypothetical protein